MDLRREDSFPKVSQLKLSSPKSVVLTSTHLYVVTPHGSPNKHDEREKPNKDAKTTMYTWSRIERDYFCDGNFACDLRASLLVFSLLSGNDYDEVSDAVCCGAV